MVYVKYVAITVDDECENVAIARESDEKEAIQTGEDNYIYGYVPDEIYELDNGLANYVENNLT